MPSKVARKKRMTQGEIISHFVAKTGLKRAEVKKLFDELLNVAGDEVRAKGQFTLPGIGKFVLSERRAREGRNPLTGDVIQIPAKTTLRFRAARSLQELAGEPTKRGKP